MNHLKMGPQNPSKYQTNTILEMQGGSIDTRFLGYPIFRDVDVRAVRDGDAEIMKLEE